jgi:hypothetical protein
LVFKALNLSVVHADLAARVIVRFEVRADLFPVLRVFSRKSRAGTSHYLIDGLVVIFVKILYVYEAIC